MKIYLAGPEVFLPDAIDVLAYHRKICKEFGWEGLSPMDSVLEKGNRKGMELAREIFRGNAKLIQDCDIVVANCNSFRGATVDDGTAWEIGYASALGKTIYGYISEYIPLVDAVCKKIPTQAHSSGYAIDEDGYLLNEDFGNAINLMLEFSIQDSEGKLVEGSFRDCLKAIKTDRENNQ